MSEVWESGDAYEPYVGRWSRLVATKFLDWLDLAPQKRWLDVGCGTGALSAAILAQCEPTSLLGIDPSLAHVAWASAQIQDSRAHFVAGDAANLPHEIFDVVVSGLVLNFVPDPSAAVMAMRDVAPKGIVAAYVWDYSGRMELMRHFWEAAVALDPSAAELDEGRRFEICRPERLESIWRDAGFTEIETQAIDVPTVFRDFDDFWSPFLGGQAPAPGYAMSLDVEHREALRDRIRSGLPESSDGSIPLIARAWAVQGR